MHCASASTVHECGVHGASRSLTLTCSRAAGLDLVEELPGQAVWDDGDAAVIEHDEHQIDVPAALSKTDCWPTLGFAVPQNTIRMLTRVPMMWSPASAIFQCDLEISAKDAVFAG